MIKNNLRQLQWLVACVFCVVVVQGMGSKSESADDQTIETNELDDDNASKGDASKKNAAGAGPSQQKIDVLRDVLFPQIYSVIQQHYVEEPDKETLIQGAIDGMLSALDPHSSYMNPKEYKEFRNHTQGSMIGVGIQIVPDRGAIRVIAPIEDTPAYRADIKPGDFIIKIDGEYVFGMGIDEAVRRLRGTKAGTKVNVTVSRGGEKLEKQMRREEIKINSVKWGVFKDVGYIRISTFDEVGPRDFEAAVQSIKKQLGNKLQGLVVDVRFNPGGLLNECAEICNHLLDGGVVVSSKGRTEGQEMKLDVKPSGLTKGIPLVVLIDEGSASASEILAAAVQDHKRGIVLGVQSYGKGTVQVVVPFGGKQNIPKGEEFAPLRQERAIRLTIARYYSPNGRSIQGKGVTPDIVVEPAKIEKIQRPDPFRESDYKHALDAEETERRKDKFLSEEKKRTEKSVEKQSKHRVVKKQLDLERLAEMYEEDYQFLRAIDTVKTLHLAH